MLDLKVLDSIIDIFNSYIFRSFAAKLYYFLFSYKK